METKELKFVRLTLPEQFSIIPPYLFEQVKGADYKIERLYQFGPVVLASPLTFLYVMVDDESKIKGLLWFEINPFSENIAVNTLSVDKEYQNNGAIDKAEDFIKKIMTREKLEKMEILTSRPDVYEKKHGWQRSEKIVLEK